MFKKTLIHTLLLLLIQTMLLSSTTVGHISHTNNDETTKEQNIYSIEIHKYFSTPKIKNNSKMAEYINVHLKEANFFLMKPGKPILPFFSKTFELPFGTKILDTQCILCSDNKEIRVSKKVVPAAKPIICSDEKQKTCLHATINPELYNNNNNLYPDRWYSIKLGSGLNRNNKHVLFVTINMYPIRYDPLNDEIFYVNSIKVKLTYKTPDTTMFSGTADYDLLIIAYPTYASFLRPLVHHKNSYGIHTKLVTLKEIYDGTYFPSQGRDKPEQIKYFIKDAIENWEIKYVMLVGNFRKIPVRYSHLETDKGNFYEELEFISDLYYADIYDPNGNFSTWDSDNDSIFAEWPWPESQPMEDMIDLYPDVYVGRLACQNVFEVIAITQKIIDYEKNTKGSTWYNTMIVCGGDTFDKAWEGGTDYNEGEVANEKALEYMQGFTPVRLWASLGNLTRDNISSTLNNGAGFIYFAGHGNPRMWATHKNGDYKNWTEGWRNREILQLKNHHKYPILMVGGCHNSQFDVTPLNLIKDPKKSWIFSTWVPECWSWVFVKKTNGGAIASIGSTGYGGVNIGDFNDNGIPDCIEGADGWFETEFFRLYAQENIDILGETYGQIVTEYVQNFSCYSNRYDCKIVETHALLGDPSLKIGGYLDHKKNIFERKKAPFFVNHKSTFFRLYKNVPAMHSPATYDISCTHPPYAPCMPPL